jgi:hypothetical protein
MDAFWGGRWHLSWLLRSCCVIKASMLLTAVDELCCAHVHISCRWGVVRGMCCWQGNLACGWGQPQAMLARLVSACTAGRSN